MILPIEPYQLEREMLEPLVRSLPTALGCAPGAPLTAIVETPIANVIPDVLLGVWNYDPGARVRKFGFLERHVLAAVESAEVADTRSIARILHVSDKEAKGCIQKLVRAGALIETPCDRISIGNSARADRVEIIAVEAKMRRWRDAVAQASAYRQFSDRAFVCLDGNQISLTAAMKNAFHDKGVGLLLQHRFVLRQVIPATRARSLTAERVRAADKLAAGEHLSYMGA